MPRSDQSQDRTVIPVTFRPRATRALQGYYRLRADECLRLAEEATDPDARDHWLSLANMWTHLTLPPHRQ